MISAEPPNLGRSVSRVRSNPLIRTRFGSVNSWRPVHLTLSRSNRLSKVGI